jgi:Flp pilus assembly protein CpaB
VITLLVTPEGAEKLALASVDGRLQLALRHPLDLDLNDPAPVKKADLYSQAASSSPPPVRRVSRPRPRAKPTVVAVKPAVPRLFEVELIQGNVRETIQFEVMP